MGIESGPSGATGVAASTFGPKFESVGYWPIDSLVVKGELENTMPYTLNQPDLIKSFGADRVIAEAEAKTLGKPNTLDTNSVIAEAEYWLASFASPGLRTEPTITVSAHDGEDLGAPVWEIAGAGGIDQLIECANQVNQEEVTVPFVIQAEQIAAAAWKNTEPTTSVIPAEEWAVLPEIVVDQKTGTEPITHLQPQTRRIIRPAVSPSVVRQAEATYAPVVEQQLVEKIVEEKVTDPTGVANAAEEPFELREEQETQELRLKYVEDEPVSRQRKYELKEAIKKAGAEAEKEGIDEIDGSKIKKFFAPEHAGNRSGIAEDGVADGSLLETYQEVSAESYESVTEAVERADAIVDDKKPVTKGAEGEAVKEIDIARVRRDPLLKSHPTELVVTRVVKKIILAEKLGQRIIHEEVKPEPAETPIEDNPDLAEVFRVDRLR